MHDLEGVAESIDELCSEYTVIRAPRSDQLLNGLYQPSDTTEEDISATVHPAKGEQLIMPNGEYATAGYIVHSRAVFQIASLDGKLKADRIRIKGRTFEANECRDWSEVAGFYKTIALLEANR